MVERVQVLSVPYASRTASVCLDLDFPHLHREVIHHFTAIEFFQTQWFTVSHRQSTMLRSSFMIHMIWISYHSHDLDFQWVFVPIWTGGIVYRKREHYLGHRIKVIPQNNTGLICSAVLVHLSLQDRQETAPNSMMTRSLNNRGQKGHCFPLFCYPPVVNENSPTFMGKER